uniref:Uncharacterized protein n=1 Tax=Leptobrachium leishanense TaxID=445787 RepID=A0A8C5R3H4_9ANUR
MTKKKVHRDELELERLRCRRRAGDRERRLTGERRRGEIYYLLLIRGGERRHMGGGGIILRGGLNLRGKGRWVRTAEAVISWPSICPLPPSMYFRALTASSAPSNST